MSEHQSLNQEDISSISVPVSHLSTLEQEFFPWAIVLDLMFLSLAAPAPIQWKAFY